MSEHAGRGAGRAAGLAMAVVVAMATVTAWAGQGRRPSRHLPDKSPPRRSRRRLRLAARRARAAPGGRSGAA